MFLLRDIQRTASSLYKQGLLDLIKGMQSVSARALKRTHVSSGRARSDGCVPVSEDIAHGGPRPCGTPAARPMAVDLHVLKSRGFVVRAHNSVRR